MQKQTDAMRVMAEKYFRLAKTTADPQERKKFFDYAAAYAQLSEHSARPEAPTVSVDKLASKQK